MTGPEAEKALLLDYLRGQRRHVLEIIEDLDDDAMRRPVLPSGWTCVEMIHHLALDEEQFWFRAVVAGEQDVIAGLATAPSAWEVDPALSASDVIDLYRREIGRADAIIEATPLDAPPAWWPEDLFGSFRLADLREILLHMITEVACHAGHLDAVRELIDGRQWLVLTD